MRTFIVTVIILIGIVLMVSYTTEKPQTTQLSILRDITDKHLAQPSYDEIFSLFDLSGDNMWNGISIRFSDLSDVSYSHSSEVNISSANKWLSNELQREKEIKKFKTDFTSVLNNSLSDSIGKSYSSVYLPIAHELTRLSQSKAQRKVLLVYSDLMENDPELSLYTKDNFKLLTSDPRAFRKVLERQAVLPSLTGIEVYLIYQPSDAARDMEFRTVSEFYRKMLDEKGARITIGANLAN